MGRGMARLGRAWVSRWVRDAGAPAQGRAVASRGRQHFGRHARRGGGLRTESRRVRGATQQELFSIAPRARHALAQQAEEDTAPFANTTHKARPRAGPPCRSRPSHASRRPPTRVSLDPRRPRPNPESSGRSREPKCIAARKAPPTRRPRTPPRERFRHAVPPTGMTGGQGGAETAEVKGRRRPRAGSRGQPRRRLRSVWRANIEEPTGLVKRSTTRPGGRN